MSMNFITGMKDGKLRGNSLYMSLHPLEVYNNVPCSRMNLPDFIIDPEKHFLALGCYVTFRGQIWCEVLSLSHQRKGWVWTGEAHTQYIQEMFPCRLVSLNPEYE